MVIEVAVIAGALLLAISFGHMVGVVAAALAALSGRLCANSYLRRCTSSCKISEDAETSRFVADRVSGD